MDRQRLRKQLKKDEGLVLHAYEDSLKYWTIGVGRLIDGRKGGGITEEEAMMLLENDITRTWDQLTEELPWVAAAPDEVQEVLANMAFNLGIDGLLKFKNTLGLLEAKRYKQAADEMLNSQWAGQVKGRAERLAEMLRKIQEPAPAV